MFDMHKHIFYWQESAAEDWQVAQDLLKTGRVRHALFFVQLTLEKIIKAHVCRVTQELAPRIHNLVRLAELAQLPLDERQRDILADLTSFSIEGRYPDIPIQIPTMDEAKEYMRSAGELYEWLKGRLL